MPNKSQSNIDKFSTVTTLRSGNKILDLTHPVVMGILNLTPDSFYAGSRHQNESELLQKAEKHLLEEASILDLGAVSTRPGAKQVSEEEEVKRILSSLKLLRKEFPKAWISVDTWRSSIAKTCIGEGADMINDISGGRFDSEMPAIIGKNNTPYVLMHIKGEPHSMQKNPVYENVVSEIADFFSSQVNAFNKAGADQIILDPGFGFGKTLEHNYQLLKHLKEFLKFGYPLLVGVSRKSMIHKLLKTNADQALNGTTAVNTTALLNGAKIIRVHDVKEAMETIKIVRMYQTS